MTRIVLTRPVGSLLTLAASTALSIPVPALAQTATQPVAKPAPKPPALPKLKELTVSPAAAPVPALKYRLLPSSADLNSGDAAPIYLRIRFQGNKQQEEAWRRT